MSLPRTPLSLFALMAATGVAHAQTGGSPAWEGGRWTEVGSFAWTGLEDRTAVLDYLGDLNGDGMGEVVIGFPDQEVNGAPGAGVVQVRSWPSGAILHEYVGSLANEHYGLGAAAAGDVDLDGVQDFYFGLQVGPEQLEMRIHSGATGVELLRLTDPSPSDPVFGATSLQARSQDLPCVAAIGDINNDEVPDFAVGSPLADPRTRQDGGVVEFLSGVDGSLIRTIEGNYEDNLGRVVKAIGDVDGDLVQDVLITALHLGDPYRKDPDMIFVYSGATGALITETRGANEQLILGRDGFAVGDQDGDGVPDFALTREDPISGYSIEILRGNSAEIIRVLGGQLSSQEGMVLGHAVDVDLDGRNDLLLGDFAAEVGNARPGVMEILDGWDASSMYSFAGPLSSSGYGAAMSSGDIDGDGQIEVLMLDAAGDGTGTQADDGVLRVFRFQPGLVVDSRSVSLAAGGEAGFAIDFGEEDASRWYRIVASAAGPGLSIRVGIDIPLAADSLFQTTLAGGKRTIFPGIEGVLDLEGQAHARLLVRPKLSSLIGSVWFSAIVIEPSTGLGVVASVARGLEIHP